MKDQSKRNPLLVKAAAFARSVAQSSDSAACWIIYNQPKEPVNITARLQAMKKRENGNARGH